jgi:hypothetical protein
VLLAPGIGGLELRVARIVMLHGVPLLAAAGLTPRRRAIRTPAKSGRIEKRGVAILGTRGIPANYGGFETFAENLARRLVERGVPVTVYCRRHYASGAREWRGIRLVTLPTVRNKYLDTVVHTALSAVHLLAASATWCSATPPTRRCWPACRSGCAGRCSTSTASNGGAASGASPDGRGIGWGSGCRCATPRCW